MLIAAAMLLKIHQNIREAVIDRSNFEICWTYRNHESIGLDETIYYGTVVWGGGSLEALVSALQGPGHGCFQHCVGCGLT